MKNKIDSIKQQNPPTTSLVAANTPPSYQEMHTQRLLGWGILPLRLFLGLTFIYGRNLLTTR
jgi:hypothetical protein